MIMKLRSFIFTAAAAVMAFVACEQKEDLGSPDIQISANQMSFEEAGGEQTLTVTATRDWTVQTDADWVVVSPESGSASANPQTVSVSVLKNTGMDRSADLKFTIGMKSRYLTVNQAGPGGSAEALIVYFNNFDKQEATKTYGSGSSWPYLDQFDGWMNATGTGVEGVSYTFKGMSARANSTSDSNYSDYAGSGKNNMFFGSSAYFSTNNIALNGATGLTLTFGTEKYSQDNGSVFTNSEFKIYLSNDGAKWVELTDYTFAGGTTEGRWNLATANFTVPAGTETLSICMQVTVASSYRMDDMKLVISEGGAAVDFTKGVEMDFASGNTGGGNQGGSESDATAIYSNNYDKTAAVQDGSYWPYLDQSDAWKNAAGTGAANVTYNSKNVTVRNNSNSNGNYSDYAGSGLNNLFFGKSSPYFSTNNIALGGATNLTLTFGTEKFSQTLGSVFTNSEFHIWLSADGTKWVELTDYTFAGGTKEGRWNVATANFTVPAGTANLSICMQVDAESAYRLDDFKLVASTTEGAAIDFSKGVEKDFSAGGTGGNEGGDTPAAGQPTDLVKATVAEFLAAAESSDVWYELTGEIISIAKETYGNFTIKDATAEVYIYGMTSKWVGSNDQSFSQIGLKVGDTVTLGTLRGSYNGTPQGGGNPVPAFYISHVAGEGSGNEGGEDPVTPPAGGEGEYEPNITWTLGANAYDNTSSGNSKQTATVNGVSVKNLLKLGKSSAGGDATLHIPAGTSKIGFYCVAWTGKTATVKFSVNGTEIKTITPAANSGATGNAPYKALNVAPTDYYEVEVSATAATDVKVETLDASNGRALFIGLKAF